MDNPTRAAAGQALTEALNALAEAAAAIERAYAATAGPGAERVALSGAAEDITQVRHQLRDVRDRTAARA